MFNVNILNKVLAGTIILHPASFVFGFGKHTLFSGGSGVDGDIVGVWIHPACFIQPGLLHGMRPGVNDIPVGETVKVKGTRLKIPLKILLL
ncbi:MAG: hypothetical protein HQ551_00140 [Desulfobacteraceae bacterium]|nr:hypothetical protein [Desulfobacteraceae bacterium]